MKEKIKEKLPFITRLIRNVKIKKRSHIEYINFKNNWMYSCENQKKIGYQIILDEHSLEKGMTSKKPRYFGINKVKNIMLNLTKYDENDWEKDFAYNLGLSILIEYCKFYEENQWQDRDEYNIVKTYIHGKKTNVISGTYKIEKKEFIQDALIDYDKFLSSRHSFREFSEKKITSNDMMKAINMTIKTPTACNRQMCKIYYVKNDKVKNSILKFSHGLTNFDNNSVNIIVVTYDISSLCHPGEINQGMFNSGLVSMNLVNSLHSLGIGSCYLEYNDTVEEENEMKSILQIPTSEKIAVVIAAGYYPNVSVIPCSTRKPVNEIYKEI